MKTESQKQKNHRKKDILDARRKHGKGLHIQNLGIKPTFAYLLLMVSEVICWKKRNIKLRG
jgi:hypothetical protein